MKTTMYYSVMLFVAALFFVACEPREQNPENIETSVTVSGQIRNFSSGRKMYIRRLPTTAQLFGIDTTQAIDSTSIGADGSFSLTFDCERAGYYNLFADAQITLYVLPGSAIKVYYDAEAPEETVGFKGDLAAENGYLRSRDSLMSAMSQDFSDFQMWEKDTFLLRFNELDKAYRTLFKEWKEKNRKSNPYFLASEDAEFQYQMATIRDLYAAQQMYMKPLEALSYLGEKFFSYHDDIAFDRIGLKDHRTYINALTYNVFVRAMRESIIETGELSAFAQLYPLRLEKIAALTPAGAVRDNLTLSTIMEAATSIPESDFLLLEEGAIALIEDETIRAGIADKMKAIKAVAAKTAPGTAAPDFTYEDIKGKQVSLSDFRGKYVYIDVWATWCGPCIKEIPHLKKLEKDFASKKIVFMSVSVDESKRDWKMMVEKEQLKGEQLWGGAQASIAKDFKIDGIPRFILLDQEGKIIDANAPRPSGGIREVIAALPNL